MTQLTRILSIDGGGIRGIVPATILVELEKRLRAKTRNPEDRLANHFDLIAGTSTGGILACIYLCPNGGQPPGPRFSAEQALELYMEHGDEIFDIPVLHRLRTANGIGDEKYPAAGLEEILDEYLGTLELKQLLKPCLISAYDIKRRRTFFFTQHDARRRPARNFLLKDVARATSAAPTYFECARTSSETKVRYPMIDGGVFANNPALCAYAEARKMPGNPTAKDMLIVSLGTGEVKTPYDYEDAKDWGLLEWVRPLLEIMMSGVSETVDYQLRSIYGAVGAPHQYVRIQPSLDANQTEMDNAELENTRSLWELGVETAQAEAAKLDAIVELLVQG